MSAKHAVLLVPSAVAAAMAGWQVQRMRWKEGLVAEAQAAMEQPPVDLLAGGAARFRRVATQGRYDHARAAFVGPRPLGYQPKDPDVKLGMRAMLVVPSALKSGFLLLTPLTSDDGRHTVLVNRGWVPPYWKAEWAARYAALQPAGPVAVTGVVQGSEEPSSFVPPNSPATGEFFWLDVPGIAEALGLPRSTPLVQVLTDESTFLKGEAPSTAGEVFPLPKPITSVVAFGTMPLGHFNYAVGWAAMSAAMAALALKLARKAWR
ncbi:SURF1 [Scenedesmus sp. PABB004]|nr:SURF1 [Scenedesmus sp. PABB004]